MYNYLYENWNERVAEDFYTKFEKTITAISKHPYSGKASAKKQNVRRKLITKHNCLYNRIKNSSIIVINVIDTRANPKKILMNDFGNAKVFM